MYHNSDHEDNKRARRPRESIDNSNIESESEREQERTTIEREGESKSIDNMRERAGEQARGVAMKMEMMMTTIWMLLWT